jgi:hypothetical protein
MNRKNIQLDKIPVTTQLNFEYCKSYIKQFTSANFHNESYDRLICTDNEIRFTHHYYWENDRYPYLVMATMIDHGKIVRLDRFDTYDELDNCLYIQYFSTFGTPSADGVTWDESEIYDIIKEVPNYRDQLK